MIFIGSANHNNLRPFVLCALAAIHDSAEIIIVGQGFIFFTAPSGQNFFNDIKIKAGDDRGIFFKYGKILLYRSDFFHNRDQSRP